MWWYLKCCVDSSSSVAISWRILKNVDSGRLSPDLLKLIPCVEPEWFGVQGGLVRFPGGSDLFNLSITALELEVSLNC